MKLVENVTKVLGYRLKTKIGAGSYGEVWKAEAPGGLAKAVKFVYGYHDEKRAQSELKSLDLIKELRHPFLLSLERIEVFEGQLVIVSELADFCLNTRMHQCIDAGQDGIERSELVRHMREAAEALDYISSQHSLQHLDIKPENILLVSGHVKVADFGLVKQIKDASQSLLSGLTPAYAPPELFDGRPSVYSDQYSLALVFHEMLTGYRVFTGTTTAQLAAQHLSSQPDLSRLPHFDQSVIAKALSKDPTKRFSTCCELVDGIDRSAPANNKKRKRASGRPAAPRSETTTDIKVDQTNAVFPDSVPAVRNTEVKPLKPPKFAPDHFVARPTLFVGLGNTATKVLQKLRGQVLARFEDTESVPCFGFLAIDTDLRELNEATEGDRYDRLLHDEILDIPLRSTESYREDSDLHLSWISRRWLYNIPKSGKTERLRPLGRLAFIDHLEKIQSKIRKVVDRLSRAESVTKSAETMEANPEADEFRVFVVASISGGTGSGVVADLAYTIRDQLVVAGMPDDDVNAILIKSTARNDSQAMIETGNALACLSELNHFATIEDWPGIPGSNISAFSEDGATFANTYLCEMGEQLMPEEYEVGITNISEYLFLNAFDPTASWFEACREEAADLSNGSEFTLNSFGIGVIAKWTIDDYSNLVHKAIKLAKRDWFPEHKDSKSSSEIGADRELSKDEANRIKEKIESSVVELTQQCLDIASARMLVPKVISAIEQAARNQFSANKNMLDIAKSCWADVVSASALGFGLPEAMQVSIEQKALKLASTLSDSIQFELGKPGSRLPGACLRAEQINNTIEVFIRTWKEQIENLDIQADPAETALASSTLDGFDELHPLFEPMLQLKIKRMLKTVCMKLAEGTLKQFGKTASSLSKLGEYLEVALNDSITISQLKVDSAKTQLPTTLKLHWMEKVTKRLNEIVAEADQSLTDSLFNSLDLASENDERFSTFASSIVKQLEISTARTVRSYVSQTNLKESATQGYSHWLKMPLAASDAALSACGGFTQRSVVIPEECGWTSVSVDIGREHNDEFAVCNTSSDQMLLLCEASGIKVTDVFATSCDLCPGASELITRIQSRTDIEWTYLAGQP